MKQNSKISDSTTATSTEAREINLCIEWLQSVPTVTKAINYHRSSYGYKHDVEAWAGCYISNVSFKLATHRMGLMAVQVSSQNECYNIKVLKTTNKYKRWDLKKVLQITRTAGL